MNLYKNIINFMRFFTRKGLKIPLNLNLVTKSSESYRNVILNFLLKSLPYQLFCKLFPNHITKLIYPTNTLTTGGDTRLNADNHSQLQVQLLLPLLLQLLLLLQLS